MQMSMHEHEIMEMKIMCMRGRHEGLPRPAARGSAEGHEGPRPADGEAERDRHEVPRPAEQQGIDRAVENRAPSSRRGPECR